MQDGDNISLVYPILSSSAFFSSASLFSTVMIIPCSSSVRWLRSIMVAPPLSLGRQVWKSSGAGRNHQWGLSVRDCVVPNAHC